MGLQFRKRIKVLPGVWLNLSRKGISTSVGGDGLTVNLSRRGTRTTASLPGTGLKYVSTTSAKPDLVTPTKAAGRTRPAFWVLLVAAILGAVILTNFM